MNKLEKIVNYLYQIPSDINEFFPTLIKYGSECETITEMGVRWITSTWVFLGCAPKQLISYDMRDPSNWSNEAKVKARGYNTIEEVYETAKEFGLNFKFIQANVLEVEIEPTDLLFLDTWHSYKQLTAELKLHASKVKKYIIFHDTTEYVFRDETNYEELGEDWKANTEKKQGIWPAIEEFLEQNHNWELVEKIESGCGLTIIKRKIQ